MKTRRSLDDENISSEMHDERTTVFILSDVRLFREGLKILLDRESSIIVVGAAATSEAMNQIADLQPIIVLLDASLENIAIAAEQVRDAANQTKIVAFAMGGKDQDLIACAEVGSCAFVGREGSHHDLLRAIEEVRRGELSVSPRQASLLVGRLAKLAESSHARPGSLLNLTRRESEIVPLIERGLSNKEIARELSIEATTIKNHVHNILEKTQLRRRGEIGAHFRAREAAVRRQT